MSVEIDQFNTFEQLGITFTLKHLSVNPDKLLFYGESELSNSPIDLDLVLIICSGTRKWIFPCVLGHGFLSFEGDVDIKELSVSVSFLLCNSHLECEWIVLKLDPLLPNYFWQWINYFSGFSSYFPTLNVGKIPLRLLDSAEVVTASKSPGQYSSFCEFAASPDFVVCLARLRTLGRFPAVIADENGVIIASKLVLRWNVLMVHEANQRMLIFQGVTSCDAVYIPGSNLLIIICHITIHDIKQICDILSRDHGFYDIDTPRSFFGYLVGHTRPYHCNYDSLLALQRIHDEGQLSPEDSLFSKSDEVFVDLASSLNLSQKHQCKTKDQINSLVEEHQGYLLQLGSWFYAFCEPPNESYFEVARRVDDSLRCFAVANSELKNSGALDFLEDCQPLIWVGVTGQKRRWLEQVSGIAHILNTLYESYPKMGVVFDGWTPPLTSSNYHRKEARKDYEVIQSIIKRLNFRRHGRFGVIAGLPMVDKICVGMAVDLFVANYTTGSINVARICRKPGVGHMSRRMMHETAQHIHYSTRTVDPIYVEDHCDPTTPAGYIDYSLPWQAVYNLLVDILNDLSIESVAPLQYQSFPSRK